MSDRGRKFLLVVAAILLAVIAVAILVGLVLANEQGDKRVETAQTTQEATTDQLEQYRRQVATLEDEIRALKAEGEKAKAQANTSVDQLVKSGEQPIIAAPDVVTVPTVVRTTTTQPAVIVVPVPETTTTSNTSAPPETTTTTEPPPTTTTTTTVAETTTTTEVGP